MTSGGACAVGATLATRARAARRSTSCATGARRAASDPLFFCQLEAAETAIWLVEGPVAETSRLALEQQERYVRHCMKMATGSGKTVVMAMLIAWSVLNKARQPQDRRFSDAVLVVCLEKLYSPHDLARVL